MKISRYYIFLLCCCVFAFSGQQAQAQLLVEQGKIKKAVVPGRALADAATLHNTTAKPIDVAVYLEDFEYVKPFDGSKKFYPAGSLPNSVVNWISFQPKELHLPPYSKKKINYTITVPADAVGGRYGVLFFERKDRKVITQGKVGMQVVARVGSLFFIEPVGHTKKIDLNDVELSDGRISASIKNSGNVNLLAKCFFYIIDSNGVPADRGQSEIYYISENGETEFYLDFKGGLPSGDYMAVLTFDLEDGVSSVHEFSFSVDSSRQYQITTD